MSLVARFEIGEVMITPGAKALLACEEIEAALKRHISGDWGELEDDDKTANDAALEHGGRLVSSYVNCVGEKFWVITDADREHTTFLLPEEY